MAETSNIIFSKTGILHKFSIFYCSYLIISTSQPIQTWEEGKKWIQNCIPDYIHNSNKDP